MDTQETFYYAEKTVGLDQDHLEPALIANITALMIKLMIFIIIHIY